MANKTVVVQDGKLVGIAGSMDGQVLTWDATTSSASFETPSTGGTVTSVGLTGGTSGIVIGGTVSPITTSGTFDLDAPLRFAWNTATPTAPTTAGQVAWNDSDGSLEVMLKGNVVLATMGQTIYQRAYNDDTVTLTKGMVVYISGAQGNRVAVKRAQADADATSATILGVVAESISTGQSGFVITSGMLRDLSVLPTSGFADGNVVYLSPTTPGGLTTTKPVAPQHLVLVGYVVKASAGASGELLVHPQNGYELDELHDVYVSSPANGQILIYDATVGETRWENKTVSGDATLNKDGVLTLKNTGTAATYGSASQVPVFTTDAQGRVTTVTNTAIALNASAITSGTLAVQQGGTNIGSYTIGDLLYATGTTALGKLADVATGNALISGGVGVAPSWGKIGLTTHITGTLGVNNGGTGAASTLTGYVKGNGASAMTASATIPASDVTSIPYDLPFQIPGTPPASTSILTWKAVRACTLAQTGHQGGIAGNFPVGGTVTFTVRRTFPTLSTLGTLTYSPTTGAFTSSFSAAVSISAGDVIDVVTPSDLRSMTYPYFTLAMTVG